MSLSGRKRSLILDNDDKAQPLYKKRKLNENDNSAIENESLSTEEVIHKLSQIFDDIQQPETLTVGGESNSLPLLPGLYIDKIGHIPLPICDDQIPKLIALCSKPSNANYYELKGNQFHFTNSVWNQAVQRLATSVSSTLGVDNNFIKNVKAECNKLLIYQSNKTINFVEHTNTKSSDDMFASLNIQLPSRYQKRTNLESMVIIKYKNKTMEYHLGSNYGDSQYKIYYNAQFCNLHHRINSIKSGIRMVIQYNLCWNGSMEDAPQIIKYDITDSVKNILNSWNQYDDPIALNMKHSGSGTEFTDLRGSDFTKIDALNKVSKETNLCVFTSSARRTVRLSCSIGNESDYGSDDDYCPTPDYDKLSWDEDICGREEYINDEWYDENGEEWNFGKFIKISWPKNCIGYNENDDDEWCFEDNDNEHDGLFATEIRYYSKDIAIFFKEKAMFDLLSDDENGIAGKLEWLRYLYSKDVTCNKSECNKLVFGFVKDKYTANVPLEICNYIFMFTHNKDISIKIEQIVSSFNSHRHGDKEIIGTLLEFLKSINNIELICKFIKNQFTKNNVGFNEVRKPYFIEYYTKIIIGIIVKFGWEKLEKSISKLVKCILNNDVNLIKNYCSFASDIKSVINKKCWNEISDKIWENIASKLDLNGNQYPAQFKQLDAANIVSIFKFLMLCDDKIKKQQRLKLFDTGYQTISHNKQIQVIHSFVERPRLNNLNTVQSVANLIKWNGWSEPIITCINKLIIDCHSTQIAKMTLIPQELMNNGIQRNIIDIISNVITESIINVLDLNGEATKLKKLSAEHITFLLKFMIFTVDKMKFQGIYRLFGIAYSNNVSQHNQHKIVNVMKTWDCKSNELFRLILGQRIKYLQNIIEKGEPKFSWSMGANGVKNQSFANFLKSEQRSAIIHIGNGIASARSWAHSHSSEYSWNRKNYSVDCKPGGIGKKAYVEVTKNQKYFKSLQKYYAERVEEFKSLKNLT